MTYETRCDARDKSGDDKPAGQKRAQTSSHHRKKQKRHSHASAASEDCVAHCTRSRTALRHSESTCETPKLPKSSDHNQSTAAHHSSQPEGGLLPLDERDFAYSPFSSSTVTELVESDYSVYSPTTHRSKGKKRKRSTHRSLSSRKSHTSLNLDGCTKKFKIDLHKEPAEASKEGCTDTNSEQREESSLLSPPCSYPLRNRHNRDSGPPPSTVTRDDSGK